VRIFLCASTVVAVVYGSTELMARPFRRIHFRPATNQARTAWCIYAKYPGGYRGHIISFESEAEATAWLK
jgi:hypothetical protein